MIYIKKAFEYITMLFMVLLLIGLFFFPLWYLDPASPNRQLELTLTIVLMSAYFIGMIYAVYRFYKVYK